MKRQATNEKIIQNHQDRLELFHAIRDGDVDKAFQYQAEIEHQLATDELDIFKRVVGDPLRSTKNMFLSINSAYALYAEKGGMSPLAAHFMSEKFSILIESSEDTSQFADLHRYMLNEYINVTYREDDQGLTLVDRVKAHLSIYYFEKISLSQLAKQHFVSRGHLMRVFKEETGETINDYLVRQRMEEADLLLRRTHLSILSIATMTGYSSSQYFSKVFKDTYGLAPTNYRKLHKKI